MLYDLLRHEGLALGTSSGTNVAGAIRLAKELGPGHTIVTILCDLGSRYSGKLYNTEFLKSKGLPQPEWLVGNGVSNDVASALDAATADEATVALALQPK